MSTGLPRSDDEGVAGLIALYHADPAPRGDQVPPRRPPWTWSILTKTEAAALEVVVAQFVESYNEVHATAPRHLIPPCWPHHPGLAVELAALAWTWYAAHVDPAATAHQVAEYYERYLPGFRNRMNDMLGRSPMECRQGNHPDSWRSEVRPYLPSSNPRASSTDERPLDAIVRHNFGFSAPRQE